MGLVQAIKDKLGIGVAISDRQRRLDAASSEDTPPPKKKKKVPPPVPKKKKPGEVLSDMDRILAEARETLDRSQQ